MVMSSFNLFRAMLVSACLVFTASTAYATEVECKRYDTKCVKAQKKAQFTQAYFQILDAGIKAQWDAKHLRQLFTKEEQRELKKIGLDITNRRLVQALEKKYQETFSHLDSNAWQSVLDTILGEDYVAKQIKYKLLNVAVVDRLKKELERSGKKTIKAKSGNFSTRSSARSAVVVLEDMRRAQSALMKELSKAGDDLDIDVLAEALEQTTIILVDRNEKVAKALRNPKELEKILIKASKSSGVEPVKILKKMNVAAAPAIEVIKNTVEAKIEKSEPAAQVRTKQVNKLNDSSIIDLVVTISALGDDDVPALPDDLSTLTIQELSDIYPDAEDEDYTKMMRDYARHAKLQETAKISADARWEKNQPGMLYRYTLEEVWDAGYKGQMSKALMNKMDGETAELWTMLKEVEARTQYGQLALDQEIALEQQNIAKTGKEGDDESEEGRLEQLHWDEATQIENTLIKMYSNVHAAVLFDNNQLAYIESVLDDAFKFLDVAKGVGNTMILRQGLDQMADQAITRMNKDLLQAEQLVVAAASVANDEAIIALEKLKIARTIAQEMNAKGVNPYSYKEVGKALGGDKFNDFHDAVNTFKYLVEDAKGYDRNLALKSLDVLKEITDIQGKYTNSYDKEFIKNAEHDIYNNSANNDMVNVDAAYEALAYISATKQVALDINKKHNVGDYSISLQDAHILTTGLDKVGELIKNTGFNKDLALQAMREYEEIHTLMGFAQGDEFEGETALKIQRMYAMIDSNAASGSYHDIKEMQFAMDDAATAANMDELASEIAKIKDAIANIQDEYDKAISMGASPDEAAAYMADQQAQMQQGMQQLCNNGDPNNPNPC